MKVKKLIKKVNSKIFAFQMLLVAVFYTVQMKAANADFDFTGVVESGDDFNDVAENVTGISETGFTLIKTIGGIAGIIFVFLGIQHIRKANEPNSNSTWGRGIIYVIVGGLFGSLPWFYQMSATTVSGGGG